MIVEIRRERDETLINSIANNPKVLPFISRHGGKVDWRPAISHCVILSNGSDACMVLEQTSERDWQVNTMFAETCRGRRAIETGLAMKAWMMPKWADLIFGSVPNSFRHAIWFYRQLGGKPVDSVESGGFIYTAQENETLLSFRSDE